MSSISADLTISAKNLLLPFRTYSTLNLFREADLPSAVLPLRPGHSAPFLTGAGVGSVPRALTRVASYRNLSFSPDGWEASFGWKSLLWRRPLPRRPLPRRPRSSGRGRAIHCAGLPEDVRRAGAPRGGTVVTAPALVIWPAEVESRTCTATCSPSPTLLRGVAALAARPIPATVDRMVANPVDASLATAVALHTGLSLALTSRRAPNE
jgi:hypothetical protein